MNTFSPNASFLLPLDIDSDMQVIANGCNISVRARSGKIVISGQVLRAVLQSKKFLPKNKALSKMVRNVDQGMRRADISLCFYSRRLVVLGANSAPILLTAVLAFLSYLGRKPI